MAVILTFGASTTQGFWASGCGWADMLKAFLQRPDSGEKHSCHNLGISGNTTEDVLRRFNSETKERLIEKDWGDTIFIFSVGMNDTQFLKSKNSVRRSAEEFSESMQKIIDAAKKYSDKIVFVGFYPVDESRTDPIPWNPDKSYLMEHVKKYGKIAEEIFTKNGLHYIDLFDVFGDSGYESLLEDGLHPNTEGHKLIFEAVRDFLEEKTLI